MTAAIPARALQMASTRPVTSAMLNFELLFDMKACTPSVMSLSASGGRI